MGSRVKLKESARFAGGKPPFGYRKKRHPGGGWMLEKDAQAADLVQKVVSDVLDGKPVARVVSELNPNGYRTRRHYYETVNAGKSSLKLAAGETRSSEWRSTALRNLLTNPALRGYASTTRARLRGVTTGRRCSLRINRWWSRTIGRRSRRSSTVTVSDAVTSDDQMPARWSGLFSATGVTFRCGTTATSREAMSTSIIAARTSNSTSERLIPADQAEKAVAESFLEQAGVLPVTERSGCREIRTSKRCETRPPHLMPCSCSLRLPGRRLHTTVPERRSQLGMSGSATWR